MSVVLQNTVPAVNVRDLVYGLNSVDERIVQYVIQQTVEATLEMLLDTQEELDGDLTRAEIKQHLSSAKEGARDLITDMLGDLQRGLFAALERAVVDTRVLNMQYEVASDLVEDATVAVEVNFAK